jgi:hypothetical protein
MNASSTRAGLGLWLPGLIVAAGAAVATAHGLYGVARAAGTPLPIAALYPLICDGLALVAYGATARMDTPSGRAYGWTIVVLAAGLSGLAQAAYLAGDGVQAVPDWLAFGIGAWPATAAAIVAHLLYLLGTSTGSDAPYNRPYSRTTQPYSLNGALDGTVQQPTAEPTVPIDVAADVPAGERARDAAVAHHDRHGVLPSVTDLVRLAGVARGTAGAALKALRAEHDAPRTTSADPNPRTNR